MNCADASIASSQDPGEPGPISPARRLVYAIALLPLVPAVAAMGVQLYCPDTYGFDGMRWFQFLVSTLWILLILAIWRAAIVWTLGRATASAIVALIPYAQVIYAQPLWEAECGTEPALVVAQHQITIGIWIWICVWIWWGIEKSRDVVGKHAARIAMTSTAKRIVASLGSIPVVFAVFMITWAVFNDLLSIDEFRWVYIIASAFAVAGWHVIWYGAVKWRREVMVHSILLTAFCLALPVTVVFVLESGGSLGGATEMITYMTPVAGWGIWMAATIKIWPLRSSLTQTPLCPECGYALIGLKSTKCPECGSEPTIDEVWAAGHDL
ncbi:MAG: hypothetical protein ACYTHJ_13550 [Planctomycetota bacterium]|jgi:hypothetical protein